MLLYKLVHYLFVLQEGLGTVLVAVVVVWEWDPVTLEEGLTLSQVLYIYIHVHTCVSAIHVRIHVHVHSSVLKLLCLVEKCDMCMYLQYVFLSLAMW